MSPDRFPRLLSLDPRLDDPGERDQPDGAGTQDHVVEGSDVEPCAEPGLREHAKAKDLELPQFVGECLTRPGDVAVDLIGNVADVQGRVLRMKSMAWSRVQPMTWMPVSTTRRQALQASNDRIPNRSMSDE